MDRWTKKDKRCLLASLCLLERYTKVYPSKDNERASYLIALYSRHLVALLQEKRLVWLFLGMELKTGGRTGGTSGRLLFAIIGLGSRVSPLFQPGVPDEQPHIFHDACSPDADDLLISEDVAEHVRERVRRLRAVFL